MIFVENEKIQGKNLPHKLSPRPAVRICVVCVDNSTTAQGRTGVMFLWIIDEHEEFAWHETARVSTPTARWDRIRCLLKRRQAATGTDGVWLALTVQ